MECGSSSAVLVSTDSALIPAAAIANDEWNVDDIDSAGDMTMTASDVDGNVLMIEAPTARLHERITA